MINIDFLRRKYLPIDLKSKLNLQRKATGLWCSLAIIYGLGPYDPGSKRLVQRDYREFPGSPILLKWQNLINQLKDLAQDMDEQ